MKTIVGINTVNYGSTGKLMLGLAEQARASGCVYKTFCQDGHAQIKGIPDNSFIGTWVEKRISDAVNTVTGYQGALNHFGTNAFLKELDRISPDLIHLHNLHSNFINLESLFAYIKKRDIPVIWTLHDCWAFTGHCPHFVTAGCELWKTGCHDCPLYREYPAVMTDRSVRMYEKKKQMFTGIPKMTLTVPSEWMRRFLPDSFLCEYPSRVIYNGIDRNVFRPVSSAFRKRYSLEGRFIVLAVAFPWTNQKGLDRMLSLAEQLDDTFQLVMVGTEKTGSDRILCIPRTASQQELAEIYSAADVLINPSRVESFGLVNAEALACGTPVLSYGAGGNVETFDSSCGRLVNDSNLTVTLNEMKNRPLSPEACREYSRRFDLKTMYENYLSLYEQMLK
ncbi:MAG: glycosyltransferase [Solobacterium sp.]|nr:glycosyltransferase [Solobacterium sp.]